MKIELTFEDIVDWLYRKSPFLYGQLDTLFHAICTNREDTEKLLALIYAEYKYYNKPIPTMEDLND